jgi:SAM-dependent methyltransferase
MTEARDPQDEPRVDDPYHRLDYRRTIAWPARIEREWPFLQSQLDGVPHPSVVDLGCGPGEHAVFLASKGFRVVGIDRSPSHVEAARESEGQHGSRGPVFLEGEIEQLATLTEERFGGAICLGNVLPSLEDDALDRAYAALHERMLPKGRLVTQILNYHRILQRGVRALPLNFRPAPDGDGEIVFLRAMRPADPGYITFFPTTLLLRPGADPAVEVKASREVRLRAWLWPELEALLARHGFGEVRLYGDMRAGPFVPDESNDLIFVAIRQ